MLVLQKFRKVLNVFSAMKTKIACFILYSKASQNKNTIYFSICPSSTAITHLMSHIKLSTTARNFFFDNSFNQWQNSCVLRETGARFQHGLKTELHWVEISWWWKPQFLVPKPEKIAFEPSLGFNRSVRGSYVLFEDEINEMFFYIRQGRSQNLIKVLYVKYMSWLWHTILQISENIKFLTLQPKLLQIYWLLAAYILWMLVQHSFALLFELYLQSFIWKNYFTFLMPDFRNLKDKQLSQLYFR